MIDEARRLRVAVLEADTLMREALVVALPSRVFEVVACSDLAELLMELERTRFDVALIDIAGLTDAMLAIQLARQKAPQTPLLALAHRIEPELVRRLIALGGTGLLDSSVEHLDGVIQAIQTAASGGRIFPNVAFSSAPAAAASAATRLSPREREVLGCVSAGFDNLKIAALLGITERTVKAHVSALYRKVGVENRIQLALHGLELGISAPARAPEQALPC